MPRVTLVPKVDYTVVSKNIQKIMIDREVADFQVLSEKIGWPYATTYQKVKRRPETLKVGDLVKLSQALKVPIESFLSGVV